MRRLIALVMSSAISVMGMSLSKSVPLSSAQIPSKTFRLSETLPDSQNLPGQSSMIEGTRYVVIQTKGGSLFLGPILGSLNIASKTKALAERLKGTFISIDPHAIAAGASKAKSVLAPNPGEAGIEIKPFVFLQSCYDEKYRLSLVFHLEEVSTKKDKWIGRFTYHLPITLNEEQLSNPSPEMLEAYSREMNEGANRLYELIEKDLQGKLASEDKPLKVGALHLVGSKMAWQAPEKLSFPNCFLLEEREDAIVFRRQKALLDGTVLFGGLTFGVHFIKRNLVHTFELSK